MPFCLMSYMSTIFLFGSSQQWFFLWLMMELSTLTFISLFFYSKPKVETSALYFLIQSVASFFILFSILNNETGILKSPNFDELMFLAIIMKLGLAPFHNWVPAVMLYTKKILTVLLLLVQKIIPFLWLLSLMATGILKILVFSIINLIWVSPQNMFQHSMKMIIALSSISHTSWLIMASMSYDLWQAYFSIYVLIMVFLLSVVNLNLKSIFQKNEHTPLFLILLTLGGLPPFMGFFPKMMVIMSWANVKLILILMVVVILSMIDLFVYSRVGVMSSVNMKNSMKWVKMKQITTKFLIFNLLLLLVLWV